jgi:mono/diheme cytochrome c family protein
MPRKLPLSGIAAAAVCAAAFWSAIAAAQGAPQQSYTPQQATQGAQLYEQYCSACHGVRMEDTDTAFNLRAFPRDQKARFVESVTNGKNSMPPWGGLLSPGEIDALWAYVLSRQADAPEPAVAPAGSAPAAAAGPAPVAAAPALTAPLSANAWPCGSDPKVLVDAGGNPVWISAQELAEHRVSTPSPQAAASAPAAGKLTAEVLIDTQGRVKCARAAPGQPALTPAVSETLGKWLFRPFSAGGQPVAVYGRVEIAFEK